MWMIDGRIPKRVRMDDDLRSPILFVAVYTLVIRPRMTDMCAVNGVEGHAQPGRYWYATGNVYVCVSARTATDMAGSGSMASADRINF